MKTVTLDLDYSLNGCVLYAAGVAHPHSAHLQALLDDGIAGTVAGDEAESATQAQAAPQTSAQTTEAPAAEAQPAEDQATEAAAAEAGTDATQQ